MTCDICQKNDLLFKYLELYICRQCYENLAKDNPKVYDKNKGIKSKEKVGE